MSWWDWLLLAAIIGALLFLVLATMHRPPPGYIPKAPPPAPKPPPTPPSRK